MKTCEEWARDIEAKIEREKAKRKERNNMKNKYMKLGAVAACLVLVIGAAAVIPYVANRNESANLPETTVTVTDPAQTDELVGPNGVGGDNSHCSIHYHTYHSIPGVLIDYVGQETVNGWAGNARKNKDEVTGCYPEFTIKKFIDDFDIPREAWENSVSLSNYPGLNFDLLYSGTNEEISEHYKNVDAITLEEIKGKHYFQLKDYFLANYHDDVFGADVMFVKSIPEYVQKCDIKRDDLEKLAKEIVSNGFDPNVKFEYNFGLIYNEDGSFKELPIFEGMSGIEVSVLLDDMFCGLR